MTDQEKWNKAVELLGREYVSLSSRLRDVVESKSRRMMELKGELHRFAEGADCSAICADCGGECCRSGKYHFTVVDALVCFSTGKPIVTPRFDRVHCPCLGEAGCLMEPAYRPFNCITFNCERIENRLEPAEVERFYSLEKALRLDYREVEEMFGNRYMHGLLMNFERDVLGKGLPILGGKG